MPIDSAARKNIGYLWAIKNGATHIYETTDKSYSDLELVFAQTHGSSLLALVHHT